MKLERKNGIPFYIQLKEQILGNIAAGLWPPGYKLPTEREMAGQLELSRNTVSQAYKELENEGVLSSAQGKGTFVADSGIVFQQESRKEKVLRIIDNALEEAVGLGFSIDDFVSFTHVRALEKKAALSNLKVAFVGTSTEELAQFTAGAYLGREVSVIPVTMAALTQEPAASKAKLLAADLAVTAFNQVNTVKNFIGTPRPQVVGINLEPKLDTMVRIARLHLEGFLPLVCESEEFSVQVRTTLAQAGIYPELETLTASDDEVLAKALSGVQAVIVAPGRRQKVEQLAQVGVQVIEFRTFPDAVSLNLLRSVLLEIKHS
ncbi:MAG: GntR family transcriptional regulator [Peptococcaceae bacterium]|nr:GntR family transcriptional regulator [Peptococcaceae bacterium]